LEDEVIWNEDNVVGVSRFLEKVWKLSFKASDKVDVDRKLQTLLHKTIKKVTEDMESFKYNTIISALMILANAMEKEKELLAADYELLIVMLSPFAPHISEEIWEKLGNKKTIFEEKWPQYDESLMKEDEVEMVVQVNGKVRERLMVVSDVTEDEAKETALESEKVRVFTADKEIKKIIFVPGKLINIIV